jgi:hypothetical protein
LIDIRLFLIVFSPQAGLTNAVFILWTTRRTNVDIVQGVITGVYGSVTSSIRRFAALIVLVLIGILIGVRIEGSAAAFIPIAVVASVLLAIVAYSNTDTALVFLIGFLLVLLLL